MVTFHHNFLRHVVKDEFDCSALHNGSVSWSNRVNDVLVHGPQFVHSIKLVFLEGP